MITVLKKNKSVFVAGLLCFILPAYAQHMPLQHNRALMPEAWLLSSGQPWFYRATSTATPRFLGSRAPSFDEGMAINLIEKKFSNSSSIAFLAGDGDKILKIGLKHPANENSTFLSASIDKTITAMSAGVAICDGKLSLTTKAKTTLPELSRFDIGETTLKDNLTMSSGTKDAFSDSQSFTKEQYEYFMTGKISFMDIIKESLSNFVLFARPGSTFSYKSQDPLLVGMMVSGAYGMQGKNFREWQNEHFFSKVKTADRRIHGTDRYGYAWSEGNTRLTINDWARFAVFVQESRKEPGCYGNFVREATTKQIKSNRRFAKMYDGYGYFVWTDNPDIPNSYSALGYGGQAIIWSTVNNKYFIVFSTNAILSEIHNMAKLWLESK